MGSVNILFGDTLFMFEDVCLQTILVNKKKTIIHTRQQHNLTRTDDFSYYKQVLSRKLQPIKAVSPASAAVSVAVAVVRG